jgi:hypothetical protein
MVGTLQDQQLVPQGKNLGLQGSASSEAGSESEKHREKEGRHCSGSLHFAALQTQLVQRERTFW